MTTRKKSTINHSNDSAPYPSQWEKACVFLFGVIFLSVIAYAALRGTPIGAREYIFLRILCALAAAGVAAFIPGFLHVNIEPGTKNAIRAGGAIAVFVIVFFFSPPPPPPLDQPDPMKIQGLNGLTQLIEIIRQESERFLLEYEPEYNRRVKNGEDPQVVKDDLFRDSHKRIDSVCRDNGLGLYPKMAFKDISAEEWKNFFTTMQKRYKDFEEEVHKATITNGVRANIDSLKSIRLGILNDLSALRDGYINKSSR